MHHSSKVARRYHPRGICGASGGAGAHDLSGFVSHRRPYCHVLTSKRHRWEGSGLTYMDRRARSCPYGRTDSTEPSNKMIPQSWLVTMSTASGSANSSVAFEHSLEDVPFVRYRYAKHRQNSGLGEKEVTLQR